MLKKVAIIFFVLVVIGGIIFIAVKKSSNKKDNEMKMVKVERGNIVEKALAIGRIEPRHEIAIKSKVSGIAEKIFVEVGDKVKMGEPLIEIKPNPTPLEFAEAKRNVELALVTLEYLKNEYLRNKKLLAGKLISSKEFEQSEKNYKEANLRFKLAQERLALIEKGKTRIANRNIENMIKSPINGTVLERRVNEGDPVVPLTSYQAGTELMILADMGSLLFKGTVDEIDVGKLEEGMMAQIKIGAIPDEVIEGELYKIAPKAKEERTATLFDVEIKMTKKGKKVIRAGYSANAELIINKRENVLIIPERLVEFKEDKAYIEIINSKGETIEKEVKTGLSDGLNIEIVEGLKEGDEVVERPPKEIK